MTWLDCKQRAKKVVFDSPGLVDFAIGVVDSVLKLPDRQANYRRTVLNPAQLKSLLGYHMVATAYPNSLASVGGSKIRVTFPQVRVQVTMIQVNEWH